MTIIVVKCDSGNIKLPVITMDLVVIRDRFMKAIASYLATGIHPGADPRRSAKRRLPWMVFDCSNEADIVGGVDA